jgi:hypothetical protein
LTCRPPTSGRWASVCSSWTALWNGEFALAEEIIAPGFRVRFGNDVGTTDTDVFRGPDDLVAFARGWRETRPGLRFALEATPIVDTVVGQVACRWNATRPDMATKSGIDLLALADGRITDVWSVTGNRTFA